MNRFSPLLDAELEVLQTISRLSRTYPSNADLRAEGEVRLPQVIFYGWAAHQRRLGDGRRHIIRFLLPGDIIGSLIRPTMRAVSAVQALTPIVLGDSRPLLRALAEERPTSGLAAAAREMDRADEVDLCDQVLRLSCYSSYQRVIHLILDLHRRLEAAGQVQDDSFMLPLTQAILAQALGMSVIHINRTLQELRRDGLFQLGGGQVRLLSLDKMRRSAEFGTK